MVSFGAFTTVTIIRKTKTGRDGRGNDTFSESSTEVTGCAFAPGTTSETIAGGDVVVADAIVYLPPATVIGPLDRVQTADGAVYQVQGQPESFQSPFTGITSPLKVPLRRVSGVGKE